MDRSLGVSRESCLRYRCGRRCRFVSWQTQPSLIHPVLYSSISSISFSASISIARALFLEKVGKVGETVARIVTMSRLLDTEPTLLLHVG